MKHICLALLLALPTSALAQQPRLGSRNEGSKERSNDGSRIGSNEQANGRSNGGSRIGSNEGSNGRSNDGSKDRTNDRSNDRTNDRAKDRANDRSNDRALPWWERQQTPAWERPQTPAWERPQVPAWETKNPARTLLDRARDERRLAKTPRPIHDRPPVVYVLPPYRYFAPSTTLGYGFESTTAYVTPAPPPPAAAPEVESGFLRLDVEPRQLTQVFVDGLYVGTLADLGEEIELKLGVRRIELRAQGFRSLVFDTQIVTDRTIVYRGALERAAAVAPVPSVVARPEPSEPRRDVPAPPPLSSNPIYLIPGCYLGNVMPTQEMLRPGCDLGKLTTVSK